MFKLHIKHNRSEMIVRPIFVTLVTNLISQRSFNFWVFETMSPDQQDIGQNFVS